MNLTALKSLVRIDQVSSFSKAAELENMTLSALSMQMKTLESQLGVALFDRAFRLWSTSFANEVVLVCLSSRDSSIGV